LSLSNGLTYRLDRLFDNKSYGRCFRVVEAYICLKAMNFFIIITEYQMRSSILFGANLYLISFQIEVKTRQGFDDSLFCSKSCGEMLGWICFREAVLLFQGCETEVEEGLLG